MPSMSKLTPVYRNRASLDLEMGQSSRPFQSSPATVAFHSPCSTLPSATESEGRLTDTEPMDLIYYGGGGDSGDTEIVDLDSENSLMLAQKCEVEFNNPRRKGRNPIHPPSPNPVDLAVGGLMPTNLNGMNNFLKLLEANDQLTSENVTKILENLSVKWGGDGPEGKRTLNQYFIHSPFNVVNQSTVDGGVNAGVSGEVGTPKQENQAGNEEHEGGNYLVQGIATITQNLCGGMSTAGKIFMTLLVLAMIILISLLFKGK